MGPSYYGIVGIRVGRVCRRIYFLHTAIADNMDWESSNGVVVGRYVLHQKGAPDEMLPLTLGRQLGQLFTPPASTNSAPNVVWTTLVETEVGVRRTVRLFRMTWENPKPDALVETVDLMPEVNAPASPVLFAMTVED